MKNITHFEKVSFEQFQKDILKNTKIKNKIEEMYDNIQLPKRATIGSAGYDFFLPFDIVLKPQESIIIPTGIRCQMNDEYVLQIYPRSSLGFKFRLQLDNVVGIIDSDYYYACNEGHIMIKISCDAHDDGHKAEVAAGDGFAQGIFTQFGITVDDEADGVRDGGFGSTTK